MGTIISSRMEEGNKVVFEVSMDYEEAVQLNGHMHNIHVFSDDSHAIQTEVLNRGQSQTTKYFLIPKNLRKDINLDKPVKCQKLECKRKVVYIYTVDKH